MSNRIFLDTNVVLDFLSERTPFYEDSAKLMSLADKELIKVIVSPITLTTCAYFLEKQYTIPQVYKKLRMLKVIIEICDINEAIIEKSLNSNFKDFEDAVQYYSALESDCTTIVTRNLKDYKLSILPVLGAREFLINYAKSII